MNRISEFDSESSRHCSASIAKSWNHGWDRDIDTSTTTGETSVKDKWQESFLSQLDEWEQIFQNSIGCVLDDLCTFLPGSDEFEFDNDSIVMATFDRSSAIRRDMPLPRNHGTSLRGNHTTKRPLSPCSNSKQAPIKKRHRNDHQTISQETVTHRSSFTPIECIHLDVAEGQDREGHEADSREEYGQATLRLIDDTYSVYGTSCLGDNTVESRDKELVMLGLSQRTDEERTSNNQIWEDLSAERLLNPTISLRKVPKVISSDVERRVRYEIFAKSRRSMLSTIDTNKIHGDDLSSRFRERGDLSTRVSSPTEERYSKCTSFSPQLISDGSSDTNDFEPITPSCRQNFPLNAAIVGRAHPFCAQSHHRLSSRKIARKSCAYERSSTFREHHELSSGKSKHRPRPYTSPAGHIDHHEDLFADL